jgi:hypothetical protein
MNLFLRRLDEHQLFGLIGVNWAAQPLVTFEKMLALIRPLSCVSC